MEARGLGSPGNASSSGEADSQTRFQQSAWQEKKEAWLKLADDKAQAAVSRLDSNEQRRFWMQAPTDFQCARNPSALLYRLATTWWRWHCV